ncbi:MAG: hypothetical protein KQH79_12990 [Bacteroidetes bacterium]|nr:hypothetical protein [Bacteroidota bacterium]
MKKEEQNVNDPIIYYAEDGKIYDKSYSFSPECYVDGENFIVKKYKIEVQNHPNPFGEGHVACMGIRLFPDMNDTNARFKEVRIFAYPPGIIGYPHEVDNVLRIYYDNHVVNNIVSILLAGKTIGIVYGPLKSDDPHLNDKPYADIHIIEDV